MLSCALSGPILRLNALTGIDGIWTSLSTGITIGFLSVLMPLRALMGFGQIQGGKEVNELITGLNALTGIDGIWTNLACAALCFPHWS